MIIPMEKVTVLIFHKAKDKFLSSLQDFGMVHVETQEPQVSQEGLKSIRNRIDRCQIFLNHAKKLFPVRRAQPAAVFDEQIFSVVESSEKIQQELDQADVVLERIGAQIRNLTPWGDFDFESLKKLQDAGVKARFFIAPIRQFEALKRDEFISVEVSRDKVYVYFVVFEKGARIDLDCDEFIYPEVNKKKLENQRLGLEVVRQDKIDSFKNLCGCCAEVESYRRFLIGRDAFLHVRDHLKPVAEESVFILAGWVPKEKKQQVAVFLDQENVYYFFQKPVPGDRVPVLLKNNRFAKLFEPIIKLFSLPSYMELDLTAFVAPFFTLFFGLCLSDAGYGLVIFLLAAFLKKKASPDKRPIFSLLQVLGCSTFFCGLFLGTVFGVDLSKIAGIKKIVLLDQNGLFNFALVLGVIQVLFGMGVRAVNRIRQFGFAQGVSSIGWILIVLGLAGLSVSKASAYVCYLGIILILLFNDMSVSIPVRIGKGLWDLYGITGVFGDVLSYIRLFALGVSTSILGLVINDSASQIAGIPYVGFPIALVFFIAFHSLNLALGCLSSFVHPLRLTFVEFYKNSDFHGGGKPFVPFSRPGIVKT